jgi:hypothetical protein
MRNEGSSVSAATYGFFDPLGQVGDGLRPLGCKYLAHQSGNEPAENFSAVAIFLTIVIVGCGCRVRDHGYKYSAVYKANVSIFSGNLSRVGDTEVYAVEFANAREAVPLELGAYFRQKAR